MYVMPGQDPTALEERPAETAFRRWREAQGLSLRGTAKVLGMSLSNVFDLDHGARRETGAPALPDRRTRLAMRAIADGLEPWPEDDEG